MATKANTMTLMRVVHRYLGFFLVGIMAMYALSGTVLIFRNTDFLKQTVEIERELAPNLSAEELGQALRMRGLKADKEEGDLLYFKQGTYNKATGVASYTEKKLPVLIDKMTHVHKATTDQPLYWLNIFFGASLLFFVVSSFWMFRPKTSIFRKGMYFTIGGFILTLIMLWV
ncbi:MAG: PepSY domain-containing protein [Bacteroidia bacterium]|nr:PepSY domain-containing protein [Bacteroidia bacterium]